MVQGSESILSATILCGLQVTRSIPHDLIISASKLGRGLEEARLSEVSDVLAATGPE